MQYTLEALRTLTKTQTRIMALTLASAPDHSYTEWEIARLLGKTLPKVMGETSGLVSKGYLKRNAKQLEVR